MEETKSVKQLIQEIENKKEKVELKEEEPTTESYTVYKIYSLNDLTKYYISYKENLKFLSNVVLSSIQRYKFYCNGNVKKWCGLYIIIDLDKITIEQLNTFNNIDDTIKFIESYKTENEGCMNDMPKQDLSCKQKIKCEIGQYAEKKEYFKEHYKKKCLNKEYSDKQKEYYEKNKDVRKAYCKAYYKKQRQELLELRELKKKSV